MSASICYIALKARVRANKLMTHVMRGSRAPRPHSAGARCGSFADKHLIEHHPCARHPLRLVVMVKNSPFPYIECLARAVFAAVIAGTHHSASGRPPPPPLL